jgi:hypothetical protein
MHLLRGCYAFSRGFYAFCGWNIPLLMSSTHSHRTAVHHRQQFCSGPPAAVARQRQWPTSGSGPPAAVAHQRQWPTSGCGPPAAVAHKRQGPSSGSGPPAAVAHQRQRPTSGRGPPAAVAHQRRWPTSGSGPVATSWMMSAAPWQRQNAIRSHLCSAKMRSARTYAAPK